MNVYSRAADCTGQAERLTTSEYPHFPEMWSADGQPLIIHTNLGAQGGWFVTLDAENRITDLLIAQPRPSNAAVSPDGRRIEYISFESGDFEVYVWPFPNVNDDRSQVSRDGLVGGPVWGPDGRELFFRDNFTTMRRFEPRKNEANQGVRCQTLALS